MTITYTAQDVDTVIKGVTMSSFAIAIADIGLVPTASEAAAMAKEIAAASKTCPDNTPIQTAFFKASLNNFHSLALDNRAND